MAIEAWTEVTDERRAEVEALVGPWRYEPAWYTSLNAERTRPAWFVARSQERLVGLLTVFAPRENEVEVSAFVHPDFRRRGLFTALWNECRRLWPEPGRRWLLVAERSSGEGLAVAHGLGRLAFTEATLGLEAATRPPFEGLPDSLTLVGAQSRDLDALVGLHQEDEGAALDYRRFLENVLLDPQRELLVLARGGFAVGAVGLGRVDETVEVFGLVVAAEHRGRGWGRALLQAALERASSQAREFRLEVDSSNARAEALYRSLGFTDRRVVDYYKVFPASSRLPGA